MTSDTTKEAPFEANPGATLGFNSVTETTKNTLLVIATVSELELSCYVA